jgi:hypothetical protein
METVEDIITDEQVTLAWGNADFGNVEKRDVIKFSLLKWACGYETGKTARNILKDLGLITMHNIVSKRGKRYLYVAFKHSSQEQSY